MIKHTRLLMKPTNISSTNLKAEDQAELQDLFEQVPDNDDVLESLDEALAMPIWGVRKDKGGKQKNYF